MVLEKKNVYNNSQATREEALLPLTQRPQLAGPNCPTTDRPRGQTHKAIAMLLHQDK